VDPEQREYDEMVQKLKNLENDYTDETALWWMRRSWLQREPPRLDLVQHWLRRGASLGFPQATCLWNVWMWMHSEESNDQQGIEMMHQVCTQDCQDMIMLLARALLHKDLNSSRQFQALMRLTRVAYQLGIDDEWDYMRVTYARVCCLVNPEIGLEAPLNLPLGVELLQAEARKSNGLAASHLVYLYSGKHPVMEKDDEKHMLYMRRAAELGNTKYADCLAHYYRDKDPWQYRKWNRVGASYGSFRGDVFANVCNGPECSECDVYKNYKKCSRCKLCIYCSAECQKAHWENGHKEECPRLKKSRAEYETQEAAWKAACRAL